jgi:hypothetical protein
MRSMLGALAIALVTLCAGSSADAKRGFHGGTYASNATHFCSYTPETHGDTIAQTQSQTLSGTFDFSANGGLAIEFVSHNFNVPVNGAAMSRSTVTGTCSGTYTVGADGSIDTDVACDSHTIEGVGPRAGVGTYQHVEHILARLLPAGNSLYRMPTGAPDEEVVEVFSDEAQTVKLSTAYRMCTRMGPMQRLDD